MDVAAQLIKCFSQGIFLWKKILMTLAVCRYSERHLHWFENTQDVLHKSRIFNKLKIRQQHIQTYFAQLPIIPAQHIADKRSTGCRFVHGGYSEKLAQQDIEAEPSPESRE